MNKSLCNLVFRKERDTGIQEQISWDSSRLQKDTFEIRQWEKRPQKPHSKKAEINGTQLKFFSAQR